MVSMQQLLAVLRLAAGSFPARFKASLVIIVGLACVTAVPLALVTLAESLKGRYLETGMADRALVLSQGARKQSQSRISPAWAGAIMRAPGIRKWHGQPLADFEISAGFNPLKTAKAEKGNARMRGIGVLGFELRPELKLLSGHPPRPGSQEVIVGIQAQHKFADFEIGRQIEAAGRRWHVVGTFATGTTLDGDVVADAAALKAAKGRSDYDIALLALNSPDALQALQRGLRSLPVTVMGEPDYYARLWFQVSDVIYYCAYVLLVIMGGGALAATIHTVYAATSARANEIVILRAIGFNAVVVSVSVVVEAVVLACAGALIGVGIDWLWLEGYPYNGGVEGGVFPIQVTPHVVALALGWAIVIGGWGAMMPSLKVARGTVVEAMRDL